ncbi:hypothetical protein Tco_0092589 [Tanacetum coccineum]
MAITQSSRVVIGEVAHREPEVEGADHRKKLKGLETLYEAAQYHLNMKKARKASDHVFFIQQLAKGSREGYGVTLDVPDELVFKSSNKGAGVTPEVLDKPSDYSSSSSSDFKFGVEDISRDNEPAGDAQVDVQMTEAQPEKPEATLISSHQTLSSAEFTSQFLNDNPHITVNDMLKDPVEPEFQSMVDILVTQEKPTEPKPLLVDTTVTLIPDTKTISLTQPPQTQTKRRKTKVILKKSNKPDSQVESGELECRVTRLEKKVHAMSSFNLPEAIDNSVKAHLKNVLPKDVPYCGKIKLEKAKKSMPKNSSTPVDQAALDEFEEKD